MTEKEIRILDCSWGKNAWLRLCRHLPDLFI
jgi:hypothetical protein